jgi:hypothetical protein
MSLPMTDYAPMTDTAGHKDPFFASAWASMFMEPLLYDLPHCIALDELFPYQGLPIAHDDYEEVEYSREDSNKPDPIHHGRVYEQLYVVSTRVLQPSSRLQLHMLCPQPHSYLIERAGLVSDPHRDGRQAVYIPTMLRKAHLQSTRGGT